MLDLKTKPRLSQLSSKNRELLSNVDDYALDYNIFLSKGIDDMITGDDTNLKSMVDMLFASIPETYTKMIYNPIDPTTKQLTHSTTSALQNRLLSLLIQERHRRDIDNLNKNFENKIKYVELEDPRKYEIKSRFYQTFNNARGEYLEQFNRLALLQSLEYDFEHELDDDSDYQTDDDLIDHFCDEAIQKFKLDGSKTEEDVINSEIVRVLLPLASQVIMGQGGDDDDDDDEEEEKDDDDDGAKK